MATIVKLLRVMNGDNQEELAALTKLTRVTFNLKENGKSKFNVDELQILADRYNVSIKALIEVEATKKNIMELLQK